MTDTSGCRDWHPGIMTCWSTSSKDKGGKHFRSDEAQQSSLMDKEWLAEWAPLTYRLASPQAAVRWRCQAMTNTPLGVSWHRQAVKLGTNHPKSSQKLQFGTLQKSENIIDLHVNIWTDVECNLQLRGELWPLLVSALALWTRNSSGAQQTPKYPAGITNFPKILFQVTKVKVDIYFNINLTHKHLSAFPISMLDR